MILVNVRFTPEQFEEIKKYAKDMGLSYAAFIRYAVLQTLKVLKKEEEKEKEKN